MPELSDRCVGGGEERREKWWVGVGVVDGQEVGGKPWRRDYNKRL